MRHYFFLFMVFKIWLKVLSSVLLLSAGLIIKL